MLELKRTGLTYRDRRCSPETPLLQIKYLMNHMLVKRSCVPEYERSIACNAVTKMVWYAAFNVLLALHVIITTFPFLCSPLNFLINHL